MTTRRRRLGDLYVLGRDVTISDGRGDAVTIWLNKLNEVDRDAVLRRANAAKARYLIEARNEQSELYQAAWAQILDFDDRRALVSVIIADEVIKFRRSVEAELGDDKETWGKDGYLQGLVDAWFGDTTNEGLKSIHIDQPEDPEVVRVLDELNRFSEEVTARVSMEADRLEADWVAIDEEKLSREATHHILKRRSEEVFVAEFERQQLFYVTREVDDHKKRYFGTIQEIDDLAERVRNELMAAYSLLVVDSDEAKDSPAIQDSSSSSESPAPETTPEASGLEAASA